MVKVFDINGKLISHKYGKYNFILCGKRTSYIGKIKAIVENK